VLLITDGKSHDPDVQALSQRGRRISVVLVGEDSLEANVGHLAALTGGESFVAAGADLVAALESAVRSLKIPYQAGVPMDGSSQRVAVRRGGMSISAQWQPADGTTGDELALRAVAAMAGSALHTMATGSAAQLAEAEGLVTHLPSLVLIDEAATEEAFIPATRKVALATPRTVERLALMACREKMASFNDVQESHLADLTARKLPRTSGNVERAALAAIAAAVAAQPPPAQVKPVSSAMSENALRSRLSYRPGAFFLADAIGWDQAPHRLQTGDLADLDPTLAAGDPRSCRSGGAH
jgi:hypothetical protein